mmetsp:Transcript_19009/g.45024  ORF Transcript_19009/g.45024 Transcript_19009/m.45024 type:complete len:171 (+) Transcript_19009:39-551(+)
MYSMILRGGYSLLELADALASSIIHYIACSTTSVVIVAIALHYSTVCDLWLRTPHSASLLLELSNQRIDPRFHLCQSSALVCLSSRHKSRPTHSPQPTIKQLCRLVAILGRRMLPVQQEVAVAQSQDSELHLIGQQGVRMRLSLEKSYARSRLLRRTLVLDGLHHEDRQR